MIISYVQFFILGMGSAIIASLAQILFISHPEENTATTLLLLSCIEETICFLVIFFSQKKDLIRSPLVFTALFFGIGFTLTEITLSEDITPIHMLLLLIIHTFLTLLIFLGIRPKKLLLTLCTYFLVLALHSGYNILFAQF